MGTGWSFSDPIVVGSYVYITDSSNVKKLDKETGDIVLEKPLAERIGFFSRMAYGEGKLFVPVGEGRIQCSDANTLEPLWITKVNPSDMSLQAISPVTYYNGYVYMGATSGSADKGIFYAVSAEDEDPSVGDEIKEYFDEYEKSTRALADATMKIVNKEVEFDNEEIAEYTKNNYSQSIIREKLIGIFDDAEREYAKKNNSRIGCGK